MDRRSGAILGDPWQQDYRETDTLLEHDGLAYPNSSRGENQPATEKGNSGFGGTVFTFINSIVGGGLVALPFAISAVGLALGNILLAVMGLITMYSVNLMVTASVHAFGEARSYDALAQKAIGPRLGKVVVEISLGAFILGALTGYVNVIGATLTPLINAINPTAFCLNEKIVQIIVAGVLLVPLSSLKNMSMFRFTALLAFLCILFVSGAIVAQGIQVIVEKGSAIMDGIVLFNVSGASIFSSLPVIGCTFIFHSAFFPIWKAMDNPSPGRVQGAGYLAIGIVILAYSAISTFGYLAFGPNTKPNIMQNYPPQNILMVVAKACYLVVVIMGFPLSCFVLRSSIDRMIFRNQPTPLWRGFILSILLTATTVVLAIVLPNIQFVLGVAGAFPGAFLAFIFPALFYILLVDNRAHGSRYSILAVNYDEQFEETTYKKGCGFYFTWQKIFAWLLLLGGLAFCVLSMINLIQGLVEGGSNSNPSPGWGCPVIFSNGTAPVSAPYFEAAPFSG